MSTPKFLRFVFIVVVISVALTALRAQMSQPSTQIPPPVKEKLKFMTQPKPWWCWLFAKPGVDLVITDISISGDKINYTLRNIGKDLAAGNFMTQFCRAATSEDQQYSSIECMNWASNLTGSSNLSISQAVSQVQFWIVIGAGGGGTSVADTTMQIPGCSSKTFTAGYASPVPTPVLGHVDYSPSASGGVAETDTTNNSSVHPPQ